MSPDRPSRRAFLHALSAATLAPALRAGAQQPVFQGAVELVTVPVTVLDAAGRLVTDLDRGRFEIRDDGVERPVAQFTRERVPVSVCLVLDVSDSMMGQRIEDARLTLSHFLDHLLAAEDEIALTLFNHRPRIVSDWTRSRGAVRAQLDLVRPSGGTAIYDAIAATLPLFERRRHPRAAAVVVSDGADTASDLSTVDLRARLLRTDAFVYAIAVDAPDARASTRVNPFALRELTGPTGGYTEVIADPSELGPATERLAQELNSQYVLAYSPERKPDGQFHSIRVTVRGGDYQVRSRRGYVAVPRPRS
ncbi:MAG: VWA domain-containing protein [Acidobacteriota bacterium]